MTILNINSFETWASNKWFEQKKEVLVWNGKPVTEYTFEEWLAKNLSFLKQLYLEETN